VIDSAIMSSHQKWP